ncbi:MAG: Ppx/GppA family phosphatase [Solirubrobacterales bacterium]|nr:Ppx/GppA family phosphatase [Solirubrobacterales bacterium]
MRVGVVDIGTNSTRLLIADVGDGGQVVERDRRSTVTRLGQGVDRTAELAPEAVARVMATLESYRSAMDADGVEATTAVLTSAVRDARNGEAFLREVRERFGLEAATLSGAEEARMTFLGATSGRPPGDGPVVVIDIGGGSTELVVGVPGGAVEAFASTQVGVVRQSERHVFHDPPEPEELQALAHEAREVLATALPEGVPESVRAGIAVAGTATSCAAMVQELEPYDPARVHGFRLLRAECERLLARLAAMPLERRRRVPGLHPDRAPTIVAGVVVLLEVLRRFDLQEVEVSEHDILRGAALVRTGGGTGAG